jgi:hypothetical protein
MSVVATVLLRGACSRLGEEGLGLGAALGSETRTFVTFKIEVWPRVSFARGTSYF